MTLTRRASLNVLAGFIDYGARVLVAFVVTPLLIAGLGSSLYGVWLVLGRMTGYLSVAGGRSTQALKLTLAHHQASSDYDRKRRSLGSAVFVWFLFLPLLGSLGGVLTWYAPAWLGVPTELVRIVHWTAALLVIGLILKTLLELPRSVLEGENLGYKRMGISAVLVVVGGGLAILALELETGLVGLAAAALVTVLLHGLLFLRVVWIAVPWFGIARPSVAAIRHFLGLSGWILAWRLVMQAMMFGDIVVLGITASTGLVTVYSITKYIPEALTTLVAMVAFGIAPGLGRIIGAGDFEKARRVRGEIMVISWLMITGVAATTLIWNESFVGLWVGDEHYAGFVPMLLILIMAGQLILIRNDSNVIDLTLNVKHKVLIGAASALLSVGLSVVFMRTLESEVVGLCLGFIIGRSVPTVLYPVIVASALETRVSSQLAAVVRPAIMTALLLALAATVSDSARTGNWVGLAFGSAATLALSSALAFYGGLSGHQRSSALNRFRLALARGA